METENTVSGELKKSSKKDTASDGEQTQSGSTEQKPKRAAASAATKPKAQKELEDTVDRAKKSDFIPAISKTETRKIEIEKTLLEGLETYAAIQNRGRKTGKVVLSDVVAYHAFKMGSKSITFTPVRPTKESVEITLPESAWAYLDLAAERNEATTAEVIEELSKRIRQ
jgi:hypothetical protein